MSEDEEWDESTRFCDSETGYTWDFVDEMAAWRRGEVLGPGPDFKWLPKPREARARGMTLQKWIRRPVRSPQLDKIAGKQ